MFWKTFDYIIYSKRQNQVFPEKGSQELVDLTPWGWYKYLKPLNSAYQ